MVSFEKNTGWGFIGSFEKNTGEALSPDEAFVPISPGKTSLPVVVSIGSPRSVNSVSLEEGTAVLEDTVLEDTVFSTSRDSKD